MPRAIKKHSYSNVSGSERLIANALRLDDIFQTSQTGLRKTTKLNHIKLQAETTRRKLRVEDDL